MPTKWPKVINDPVHDLILFEHTDQDRLLLNLINTKEFQRLRRIKQLGMSELIFPGAGHTRFAHSIGVMQMARKFLDRVRKLNGGASNAEQEVVVLAAALVHDLGHGPFSHTFEKITGEKHESRTKEIVLDPETEVNKRLREYDASLPGKVGEFFGEDDGQTAGAGPATNTLFTHIVSSELDADRFDYLLRDSYMTKTQYGVFEHQWLIEHLHVDTSHNRFYLSAKAKQAAEAYVYARYHMYRAVYFHKATRAAEVMLRLLFTRFKTLPTKKDGSKTAVPLAPKSVCRAFSGEMTLAEYLALDDHTISEFLKACEASTDLLLRRLGGGLLHRRLYKATEASDCLGSPVAEFRLESDKVIRRASREQGVDPTYYFVQDGPANTPYKAYDPDQATSTTPIYVESPDGGMDELSTQSPTVEQLKKRYTLLRYYYPEEVRDEIDQIAKRILRRRST